jgi:phage terminase large subunit-like protein
LVLRQSLGVLRGGRWAASQVGLLVPRQNGKGAVLEALELFHMFVLQTPLIVHSAHKFDTSQEHFLRLRVLIEANPDLERHVKSMPTSQGHEAIILRNGNRLKFKARTVGGAGRGFSADLLVLDEAMLLPEQALDAMMPTLRARKNPQVWFTSSAGTPESDALWRIVKRGRAGADRLAYFEWGCESGVDPLDRQNWADANPGLGYRLDLDGLEDDLGLLSEDGFAREHLGIWDDAAAAGAIDPDRLGALADPQAERGRPRCSR